MANSTSTTTNERRIIRLPEVERRTGFKRSHLYNLMKEGRFPKAIKLGLRAVGWDSLAVDRWISERLEQDRDDLQSVA
ncbi:AlpA family transcriptional regulator [Azotobacter salinestris]|uniref:AlpA family transcriptional regulator n=1 Tax=Azotobacter salinestris TaxID=69964 RepID=UPI0032E04A4F